MQSASVPLRHASEEPQEFPFVASPLQSPKPMSRRSSLLNSSTASAQVLFGKAWQGTEEELQRKHEDEQRAYGNKRELCVHSPLLAGSGVRWTGVKGRWR